MGSDGIRRPPSIGDHRHAKARPRGLADGRARPRRVWHRPRRRPARARCRLPPASPVAVRSDDPATPEPAAPTAEPPVVTPDPTVRPTPEPTPRPTRRRVQSRRALPHRRHHARRERLLAGARTGSARSRHRRHRLRAHRIARRADAGFYLFRNDADMLDAYLARMDAEGIVLESGGLRAGRGRRRLHPASRRARPGRTATAASSTARATATTAPRCPVSTSTSACSAGARTCAAWRTGPGSAADTPGNPTLWQQSFVYPR